MSDNDVTPQLVFGSSDGLSTAIGVIAGAHHHLPLRLGVTVALAGALSMAAGEWLSDKGKWGRSAAMGAATFAGTLLPVLPAVFLPTVWAWTLTALLGVLLAVTVGCVNSTPGRRLVPIGEAVFVFVFVAVPTVLVGMS